MVLDPELEPLFPESLLRPTLAQAWSWTAVTSLVTAARVREDRIDQRTPHFWLAFPDDELLEAILIRVLGYASREYRCSRDKLALAKRLDPAIQPETLEWLSTSRINPTISVGGPSVTTREMPHLAVRAPMRCFRVVDAPPLLEVMFEPFQMLRTMIVSLYEEARQVRGIDVSARETTGVRADAQSGVVHRPYGDGALAATLDALVYFALGLRVGIEWGADRVSIESAFRCFNVVGQPPLQAAHFEVARLLCLELMKELGRP